MSVSSLKLAPANFRTFDGGSTTGAQSIPNIWGERHSVEPRLQSTPSQRSAFNEVVVPLDGSQFAEHALPWALQIASWAGARLRLVHVHPRMQPALHGRRVESYRDFDRLLREPMEEYMSDVVRRVARFASMSVIPMIVDGRGATDALPKLADAGADIVVMATRGRTALGRMLTESALDAMVQRTSIPLLHIRGYSCPVQLTAQPSLRHALVALNGSGESTAVLEPVADLGRLVEGSQTLFRCIPRHGLFFTSDRWNTFDAPSKQDDRPVPHLSELAKAWRQCLPRVRTSVVWSETSPAREILRQAQDSHADFIAIATRRRSRLNRLLRPGVFDYLVRHSEIPVLAVPTDFGQVGTKAPIVAALKAK
jgi:nucleotide-binding universal stress UspA family protein